MKNRLLLTTLLFALATFSFSQNDANIAKARENLKEAIKMMDNGFTEESIALLEESAKLDPSNPTYSYEIAYAHTLDKDYKKAIKILEKLTKHEKAFDLVYQMLGNSYDWSGDQKKAIKAYERGMKVFPNSGRLYLERSIMHMQANEMDAAISTLEKGVSVDPMHSSNYYWLAKLFLENSQEEEVWGMIYGELFMFLEPETKRTQEISKLLYDTYKSEITIKGDTANVSFCANKVINISMGDLNVDDPAKMAASLRSALRQSFGTSIYEPTLLFSIIGEKEISIESLSRIRGRFLDFYIERHYEKFPIVLFDFQRQIKEAKHFEAYNYWLLTYGDREEAQEWLEEEVNYEKMQEFFGWLNANLRALTITQDNKFLRVKDK